MSSTVHNKADHDGIDFCEYFHRSRKYKAYKQVSNKPQLSPSKSANAQVQHSSVSNFAYQLYVHLVVWAAIIQSPDSDWLSDTFTAERVEAGRADGVGARMGNAEFTQQALRKIFSHEGVPTALVTDNGTHFTAKSLEEWLKGTGCRHLFAAPRHLQSNGLAENFKCRAFCYWEESRVSFKSRSLRTSLDGAKTADVTFFNGSDLRPATEIILSSNGKRMAKILDLDHLSSHRRHIDHVEFNTRGQSLNGIPAASNANESFLDDLMVSEQNVISEEHTSNEEPEVSNLEDLKDYYQDHH
ncbi:hypothetical protein CLF_111454 [Clonorchis sinensis]|uniref:Integrase catalytic domain-containing protein n=1 Tax=Clonorchis sinensis TaxID=79923 RepID=G7YUX1_CLOSI|nr:hypothetical protein CLF_111454 [Clonorchis sinensis]